MLDRTEQGPLPDAPFEAGPRGAPEAAGPLPVAGAQAAGMAAMRPAARILFVDDDQTVLAVSSLMLEERGCYVKTAWRAEEALRLLSRERFDIVFIDQFLGPVKGISLMQQLALMDPELHFVIVTADPHTELAVEALKKGASDFVGKPTRPADLLGSIEYVLGKKERDKKQRELVTGLEDQIIRKTEELQQVYFSVLSSLARAVERKDLGTYGHSMRVSHYSRLIGEMLGLGEEDLKHLRTASLLHDIGKIGISDSILAQRGPLSGEQARIIRTHPQEGVEILRPLHQYNDSLPAILHHHERADGSGYPHGLAGGDIPLPARIIAVADAYDALVSDRPYRPAVNHEEALQELIQCSGRQFDRSVLGAFVEAVRKQKRAPHPLPGEEDRYFRPGEPA
jgi:cyclic di-GMP phosphodiesterase